MKKNLLIACSIIASLCSINIEAQPPINKVRKYLIKWQPLGGKPGGCLTANADGTYSTGLPNIPLVTQITNFTSGEYGTDGDFGAVDIVGLFVILVSMVGFNRVSPIVGVLISASTIFALSFFGLIAIPTIIVGAIALVIFLAWGITRNR